MSPAQTQRRGVENLVPVHQEGKWGYANADRTRVIPFVYDLAGPFVNGLAPVQVGGRFHYIDIEGRSPFERRFDWADEFSEGLAAVSVDGKFGYITKEGVLKIEPRFDWAGLFRESRAAVRINGMYGFIDPNGETVIPARYAAVSDFREGRAAVSLDGHWQTEFPQQEPTSDDGLSAVLPVSHWGFVDQAGIEKIPPRYLSVGSFHEGLAWVEVESGRYGFIDNAGVPKIDPRFTAAGNFRGGAAAVREGEFWAIADTRGALLCEAQFDGAEVTPTEIRVCRGQQAFTSRGVANGVLNLQPDNRPRPADRAAVIMVTNQPPAALYTPALWQYKRVKKKGDGLGELMTPELRVSAGDANRSVELSILKVYMVLFVNKEGRIQVRRCVPGVDPMVTGNFPP